MPNYRVTWIIEMYGVDSPQEAAARSLIVHRDPESTATVFSVKDEETGEVTAVDLGDGVPPYKDLHGEAENLFDDSVDDATHAVISAFEWMALPEGDALGTLMVRINDAITGIMQEWK